MLYEAVRPLLFALAPETAHIAALRALRSAHALGVGALLRPRLPDDPVTLFGLTFRNPVGLAAGLDKNGAYIDALGDLGFGFIEVGTVTPKPQPGNARPRLFRLAGAQALINRFGFNNEGLDRFEANVASSTTFCAAGGMLGLNIGKNAATPLELALQDYSECLRRVYPLLVPRRGYVTVNISSPNTSGLRTLQARDELEALLAGLDEERARLSDRHGARVPLAVKISPDLDDADLLRIADALVAHGVDAVIATNTTTARERVAGLPHATQPGGLSGAPLAARSTQVVALLARHLAGRLPIIGVGGITDAAAAVAKIEAGASLVQLYTGLVYRGPALVGECRRAILDHRRDDAHWLRPRSASVF
jgi:dihydroorotate dehydrogenase